jgi:nitrate/TMAO reductase-like tetraheme cytochrome c subunit
MNVQQPSPWGDRLFPLLFLSNNLISRIGVILVTSAAIFWLFLLPTYLQGHAGSAYMGIILFLMLPSAFFTGLMLIPLGIYLKRRRLGAPILPTNVRVLSWSNPDLRRLVVFVGVVTFANVVIGGNLTYRAVHHMESVQFCGATCHTVMKPEFTAYQNSPHSKVECVKCHIGPGASWFVQSKLSGVRQVFAVALDTYARPIEVPVANLRPARETCEGCHWPDKYGGDRLRVIPHYNDDGVLSQSVLLMRIGGGSVSGKGIHTAHMRKGVTIRYASDHSRQNIPWVEYNDNGTKHEYLSTKSKQEEVAGMAVREMDCMDCHNRPSHTMETPERALNREMASGEIKPDLPQIRKVAMEVLKKPYASTVEAESSIAQSVERFYKEQKPDVYAQRQADIVRASKGVLSIWQRNIFPEMKITWGTYANNIGHNDFPGCFRCHDAEHKTADGKKAIEQDCNSCHVMLAMEEQNPKVLKDLGLVEQ